MKSWELWMTWDLGYSFLHHCCWGCPAHLLLLQGCLRNGLSSPAQLLSPLKDKILFFLFLFCPSSIFVTLIKSCFKKKRNMEVRVIWFISWFRTGNILDSFFQKLVEFWVREGVAIRKKGTIYINEIMWILRRRFLT